MEPVWKKTPWISWYHHSPGAQPEQKMPLTCRSTTTKNDALNGHTFRRLPGRVDDGALASWGAESRVGMGTGFFYKREKSLSV